MTRIVAADPGGITGLAYCDDREPAHIESTELESTEAIHQYLSMCKPTIIVCERFEDRQKAKLTTSLEVIGAINLWADLEKAHVHYQSAGTVKPFWSNDKLKQLGLYEKNKRHALDAKRHLLWYVTFYCRNQYWIERLDSDKL